MKTSLRKLRGLALHKHEAKDRRDLRPLAQLDELAQASRVSSTFSSFPLPFCLARNLEDEEKKTDRQTKLGFFFTIFDAVLGLYCFVQPVSYYYFFFFRQITA